MGNYISCTLSVAIIEAQSQVPKVILPNDAILQLSARLVTAAELMLDHPGYFLVHSGAMLVSRRLFALSADEELELGAVYVMFPMDRLGSVAREEDMGRLLLATGKEGRKGVSESTAQMASPLEPRSEMDDALIADFIYLKSLSRSKRPAMDTIMEEAFH
ncbi:hypothetical protein KFK09_009475 [Dendrobium nobile]|uniref:Uncharacterized protein n=1 Tax=Dendrobium nobile TaxID=94219 RepID=A0A8T3BHK4_DENNO|nr:hypothetical protein KFK09_009475 [Dendrobium nobile]